MLLIKETAALAKKSLDWRQLAAVATANVWSMREHHMHMQLRTRIQKPAFTNIQQTSVVVQDEESGAICRGDVGERGILCGEQSGGTRAHRSQQQGRSPPSEHARTQKCGELRRGWPASTRSVTVYTEVSAERSVPETGEQRLADTLGNSRAASTVRKT